MHTGDVLVHLLKLMDVEYIFGVPGGQTLPLYDGIQSAAGITHITVREERTAAYAATAYARMTNKVGVCDATVGPGATQFPTGLGEAYNSSLPIVAILSDLPSNWDHLRDKGTASQGFHQLDMVKPFVKWCAKVTTQDMLVSLVRQAFLKAVTGRPGPVVLSIPEDIFKMEWIGELPKVPKENGYFPKSRPLPGDEELNKAVELLVQAKNPVMIAGGGVMTSGAEFEVEKLAKKLSIPVLQTFSGRGALEDTHPMGVGMVGGLGTESGKHLLEKADTCFLIGYKSGQNSSFGWTLPTSKQNIIHLDIDEEEIGKIFDVKVSLCGDARSTLSRLNSLLESINLSGDLIEQRKLSVKKAKGEWQESCRIEIQTKSEDGRLKPQQVLDELNKVTNQEDILVCDASFASGWGAIYFKQKEAGRRIITPRGMAGLGAGLPMAIGVRVAKKTPHIYLIAGDGGFAYSLGELATLKRYDLHITIIILDNENWGWMEFINKMNYDRTYFDLNHIHYAKVAEGFGLKGYVVNSLEELSAALESTRFINESAVIHVNTSLWESPVLSFKEYLKNPQKKTTKYM